MRRRRNGTKRAALVGATAAVLVAVAVPVVGRVMRDDSTSAPVVATLAAGGSKMWDGEYIASSRGGARAGMAYYTAVANGQGDDDPCGDDGVQCRDYGLEVTEPGATLRVAMDVSKRGECFALELRDPEGGRPTTGNGFGVVCPEWRGLQAYNIELVVPGAAVGTWTVRAMAFDVEGWAFRLRARLERPQAPKAGALAPNLVPWLPWEFGFVAPASPRAGQEIDRRNPPGLPGRSCHQEEVPAAKCLRFSAGLHVLGDGPMYLAFRDEKAFQHVYRSDGTPDRFSDNEANKLYEERPAGGAEFHPSHGHRHFAGMVLYELFAVDDAQGGGLRRLGTGHKHGFCTVPQQFGDWSSFEQDAQHSAAPQGYQGNCESWMALPRGWGDVYRWQRPGQYVPYDAVADPDGTMAAGHYVVRVTVDPDNLLLETDDDDNTAYAHIKVVDGAQPNSDRVVVCERGFGHSPWDTDKKVADRDAFSWAERLRDPAPTPEAC